MNFEETEIKKFTSIASQWWDTNGACKPLHDLNPARLRYITDQTSLSGLNILDIGCGGGILSESMARRGANVTGIDLSPELLEIATLHAQENAINNIHYELSTAEAYAEQYQQTFDIITCMELLEHVPDPQSLLNACAKLVKPDGHLFFSTINRTLKAYLFAIIGAEYILNILPKETHDYGKFIKPRELDVWLKAEKLIMKDIAGLNYNPFSRHAKLTNDVSINYIVHAKTL